ncbi:septum formation initiator family protein [Protaetiibacter intestinalis]|uniref:Septum formation initiator family protein n=1 Tax=Protaetiibacter intestinalis TaxID=2419774 RepID=A0A387BBA4_9MICO|nr:septum formation initiator family protein [Protaetiibacter intestinalis]
MTLAEPSRGAAWLRNFRLSGFALTALLLIVAALVVLAPRFKTLVEQRQQLAQLEQQVQDAQDQVDELDEEVARWSDPAYVEAQARDRLYYVYPGDVSYLVIDDDGTPEAEDELPISDSIQTTRVDWVTALLSSVYTAGLTDATPQQLDGTIDSPTQGSSG